MKPSDTILIALLVVLVIIVVCQGSWMRGRGGSCPNNASGFATTPRPIMMAPQPTAPQPTALPAGPLPAAPQLAGPPPQLSALKDGNTEYPVGFENPYTAIHKQFDAIRGQRNDGFKQDPPWMHAQGPDRFQKPDVCQKPDVYPMPDVYQKPDVHQKPDRIANAEREQWFAATDADSSNSFNTELAQELHSGTVQFNSAQPGIDYPSYITDLIADPRTRENHEQWAREMKPWSGSTNVVDDMHEALEAGIDFIGLRRPQAVAQYNPYQVTELDASNLIANPKFNFRGC